MPRKAREKSRAETYHIMQRGINQQQIFEDEEDNEKLLEVLKECKIISGFEFFSVRQGTVLCLNDNTFACPTRASRTQP